MSSSQGTTEPATPPASTPTVKEPRPAKVVISVIMLFLGLLALAAAFGMWLIDHTQSAPLVGAIGLLLGGAMQVPNYWLGSSSSSDKKTDYLAASPPIPGHEL